MRDLDSALASAGTKSDWFSETQTDCEQNLELNEHLNAKGAMTAPRRVQDPEGAKVKVLRYNSSVGAIAAIIERRFLITCYTKHDTGRDLRLDPTLTAGNAVGARTCANQIHPLSDLNSSNCGPGTTNRGKSAWVINTLKVVEQFPGNKHAGQERSARDRGHEH
jgi:hypothetical protein